MLQLQVKIYSQTYYSTTECGIGVVCLIINMEIDFFRFSYSDFLKRHLHLRNRLLDQGYKKIRLFRSVKKFIFRYQYLVEIYSVSAEKIISDAFSYSENV
jgi:hypothetical protein